MCDGEGRNVMGRGRVWEGGSVCVGGGGRECGCIVGSL